MNRARRICGVRRPEPGTGHRAAGGFHRDVRRFAGGTPAAFRERLIPDGGVIEKRPRG
jgi:hypothetical protein